MLIVFVYVCGPQKSCISERLSEYAGKDATKEFDDADHSDIAMALVEKCLVGDYTEVSLFNITLSYTLVTLVVLRIIAGNLEGKFCLCKYVCMYVCMYVRVFLPSRHFHLYLATIYLLFVKEGSLWYVGS